MYNDCNNFKLNIRIGPLDRWGVQLQWTMAVIHRDSTQDLAIIFRIVMAGFASPVDLFLVLSIDSRLRERVCLHFERRERNILFFSFFTCSISTGWSDTTVVRIS